MTEDAALTTPDGRQLIVRGRLWRTANPGLGAQERQRLVNALKDARRSVNASNGSGGTNTNLQSLARPWRVRKGDWASEVRCGGAIKHPISTDTW
jgi:hypothetical protein